MHGIRILIRAIYSGLLTGLVVSIPLGPAGLESVKRTISTGYKEGLLTSIGAISADAFDLVLINFGVFNLLSGNKRFEAVFWVICGIFLSVIGYISIKHSKQGDTDFNAKIVKNSRFKSMPYLTGFLLTFSNPLTHSLWLTMSGTVIRVWYYTGKAPYYAFIISIIVGMVIWFTLLNLLALRGQKIASPSSSKILSTIIVWVIFAIGIGFILFGIIKMVRTF